MDFTTEHDPNILFNHNNYGIATIPSTVSKNGCGCFFYVLLVMESSCWFLVPKPQIPGWWIWFYYVCPIAWTLQGLVGSQLADVEEPIVGPDFHGTVKGYLKEALGFESHMIGVSAVVIFGFGFFFFLVFALSLKFLNFQNP